MPEPSHMHPRETLTSEALQHISFKTTKLGSLLDVEDSSDPDDLRVFYYLIQVSSLRRPRWLTKECVMCGCV